MHTGVGGMSAYPPPMDFHPMRDTEGITIHVSGWENDGEVGLCPDRNRASALLISRHLCHRKCRWRAVVIRGQIVSPCSVAVWVHPSAS